MNKQTSENQIAIQLKGVTKEYTIHHEKPTLVEKFYKGKDEKFLALDDVSLTIKKGERVGIVGLNGSGKTTLLKIIAGITNPTNGTVKISGKVVSLIDLEAGFHEDLTGEQNIYLNGLLLGMTRNEINQRFPLIIDFANIKQFIDAPLFTYSEGMKLRLGFSIAVQSKLEILVLDEGMAVGDRPFYIKAVKKIEELFRQNKTIIIASHDLEYIYDNCSKLIILKQGRVFKEMTDGSANYNKFITLFKQSNQE